MNGASEEQVRAAGRSIRRGLLLSSVVAKRSKSPIDLAAERLREISHSMAEGTLIGSEDELVEKLGVSRVTLRQAARLLEREGLLRVRRGINGGYFAARPSEEMVETVVLAYLETLGLNAEHSGTVSTALWVEVLNAAAKIGSQEAKTLADRFTRRISAVTDDASMREISALEQECRSAIFELIDGSYVQLIFRINAAFARQHIPAEIQATNPPAGAEFVRAWKKAKLMELAAIADADPALAMMAARHTRNVWAGRGRDVALEPSN